MLSRFSRVQLFATPWTVDDQTPLSMGFSRQGYWSGLPCPPPGDLPDPGIEPASLMSPALAGGFFTTSTTGETLQGFYPLVVTRVLGVLCQKPGQRPTEIFSVISELTSQGHCCRDRRGQRSPWPRLWPGAHIALSWPLWWGTVPAGVLQGRAGAGGQPVPAA